MQKKAEKNAKFAVIEINGKQHIVRENDSLKVDRVTEPKINVLIVNDGENSMIGDPYLDKFGVDFELIEDKKDKKITVSRFRNKSRYRKNKGFRQPISMLKVKSFGEGVKSNIVRKV